MQSWTRRHQLIIDSSSPCSGIQRGWPPDARTSMGWTEHTLEYNAEINRTRNEFSTGILRALWFKTVWVIFHCCLTSKGYKGLGPAGLVILYKAKLLRRGKIIPNLLYFTKKKFSLSGYRDLKLEQQDLRHASMANLQYWLVASRALSF